MLYVLGLIVKTPTSWLTSRSVRVSLAVQRVKQYICLRCLVSRHCVFATARLLSDFVQN
jgi:hypothetical protein